MYRQGDVLIVSIRGKKFKRARKRQPEHGRIVLDEGEGGSYAYTMDAANARFYDVQDGDQMLEVLVVDQPSLLTHPEHAPIRLPKGLYRVLHRREYTPKHWMGAAAVAD